MTIKNGDMPAMPLQNEGWPSLSSVVLDQEGLCIGLTKREQFSMAAMQGLCTHSGDYHTPQDLSSDAVMYADALLAELAKGEQK